MFKSIDIDLIDAPWLRFKNINFLIEFSNHIRPKYEINKSFYND